MAARRAFCRAALACVAATTVLAGCATATGPDWPDRVVAADRMQPVGRMQVRIPRRNLDDPVRGGTTVLRLHVDAQGRVVRSAVASSSGDAVIDAAAQRAFVGATFRPHLEAGVAVAVTTLMPVHFESPRPCMGLRPIDC